MKKLFLVIFSIAILCVGCSSESDDDNKKKPKEQQVALYDKNMRAIAYIDYDDDVTIYTLEGEPVACIESEEQVYGFNGKFLGWYSDGVLYNNSDYHAVGAKNGIVRGAINTVSTYPEGIKGVKHIKPLKSITEIEPVMPVFFDSWSKITLIDFCNSGKE